MGQSNQPKGVIRISTKVFPASGGRFGSWAWHGAAVLGVSLLLALPADVRAQLAPDLTKVNISNYFLTNSTSQTTTNNYSLGPTGMRGWLYRDGDNVGDFGLMTAQSPWQILVVGVGTNTPAYSLVASNHVILGVSTGAGHPPVLFTNDARKSIVWAIGDAEAGDGVMNFMRWRAGVTNTVSIQLALSHIAYSTTAPYSCPKSVLILSNACNIIAAESFSAGVPGAPVLGLALLASGNPAHLSQVQAYVHSIAPTNLAIAYAPGQNTAELASGLGVIKACFWPSITC
jgi:hypothetical protein